MLEYLTDVIFNIALCSVIDECPDLNKFCFQRAGISLLFVMLLESATKTLNTVRRRLPHVVVTELDKDGA